ncbi:MAG: deoxyribodipyrimidine photo-lyase, partial [Phycisphaerae bacterium]|nr:deoxyribodipyrimidine photo-lyase [Phycisphaerae bacterium]
MPVIVWFRRDLRLHDNTALSHAARESPDGVVIPVFVFDDAILKHPDTGGAIVAFMLGCLRDLSDSLSRLGVRMVFLHGSPPEQLRALSQQVGATGLYFNKDYHPAAIERDDRVRRELPSVGVEVKAYKDQVIFEEREILA